MINADNPDSELTRKEAILNVTNRIFKEALTCKTDEELCKLIITECETLTRSKFGYIGELNNNNLFDIIAMSPTAWEQCLLSNKEAFKLINSMPIRGIDRIAIKEGKSRIVNDPEHHPDKTEVPAGHPKITTFLGVPMKTDDRVTGMIGLANKKGGYSEDDKEMIEALVPTVLQTLKFKRSEFQMNQQQMLLGAINRLFRETIGCKNEEDVAKACLSIAEEVTDSVFGFIGEINPSGRFDTIAISNPGWETCVSSESDAVKQIYNMEIRGIWGRVIKEGKPCIINDPVNHHDSVGIPEGHPKLTSFLGVPVFIYLIIKGHR